MTTQRRCIRTHVRAILRRAIVLCGILVSLAGTAHASDALDLFDEVAYHLALSYGGTSDVRPQDIAATYEAQIVEACEPYGDDCSVEVARPIVRAFVEALGDLHTNLYEPARFEAIRLLLGGEGSDVDFGFVPAVEPALVGLVVLEVQPGSPAERAGLRRGDRVLGFDGLYAFGNTERRLELLGGALERGTETRVTVARAGSGRFDVRMTPEELPNVREPSLSVRDDGVALLRIPSFFPAGVISERVHELLHEAGLAGSASAGHAGLVVDVRHNPGGIVDECYGAAAAFVDEAVEELVTPLFTLTLSIVEGELRRQFGGTPSSAPVASRPARYVGPVVVIVNERSGSCSEFFARVLQDAGVRVVGERTAGVADTVTTFRALFDGSGLQISSASARRGDGSAVPAYITPDVAASDDLRTLVEGRDVPLERAVTLLVEGR